MSEKPYPYSWYEGSRYVDIPTEVLRKWLEWHKEQGHRERVGRLEFLIEFREWPKEVRQEFAESWTHLVCPSREAWHELIADKRAIAIRELGIPIRGSLAD